VLYGQLTRRGAKCEVVAPTLVPVKAGDRVKTDRRDALKLARNYRAGELTAVGVPDAAHEALRDLVRAREAAKKDELRARHRLSKLLLRHGRRSPMGVKAWTMKYLAGVKREVHFEPLAQEATLLDYLHEVEHAAARILRRDSALTEAVKRAPPQMRAVIEGFTGATGDRARFGGDHRSRTGRTVPICRSKAVDGLRRNCSQRRLQWGTHATGKYH